MNALRPYDLDALRLIAEGLTNDAVAHKLDLPLNTIKSRMRVLMTKLGACNQAQLVAIAYQRGLLELPETGIERDLGAVWLPRMRDAGLVELAWTEHGERWAVTDAGRRVISALCEVTA